MAGHISRRHRPTCGSRRDEGRKCNCDGPWRARYPKPNARRSTEQIERTFRLRRDAENWLAGQSASILAGTHVAPGEAERRLVDVYDAWRETRWPGLEPKTTSRYAQVWRKYLEPEFAYRKLGTISREHVRRYVAQLSSEGVAPGTVRKVHTVLSAILSEAVELGYLKANPASGVRGLPRAPRREMLFLEADEVRTLAEGVTPAYRVLVYTAAYTGLRAGELAGLRWRNVDLLHGKLTVAEALKDVGGHLVFGSTKTHERRTLSLPRFLVEMLGEHLATSPGGKGPDALVFPGPKGGPMRHHLFYRRHFKPAVRRALPPEKERLRFHDLRHTCAALLIAEGAHPKMISARLGHSSITITLDRYGHLFPSVEEALAEKLEAAFAAATPSVVELVPAP